MKPLRSFLFATLLSAPLFAQETAPAPTLQAAQLTPQQLMERLFSPRITQPELEEVIKTAGMAGISRQQLIESKLIWGLRQQNVAWLEKILPEVEVLASNFDPKQSSGFQSEEEIKSYIAYIKALQANAKGDDKAFKEFILEAFWLSPSQAQLYTSNIELHKLKLKTTNMKVDLSLTVTTHDGQAVTLAEVLGGKKALLIDFWASWCAPCIQLMPELKKKAALLAKHDIVVAGMNKDDENAQLIAGKMHEDLNIEFPWLIEPKERPLSTLIGKEMLPLMLLVTPDGKVLYCGFPQDQALWEALAKVDPTIKKP